MYCIVAQYLLPDQKTKSYWIAIKDWLTRLELADKRLDSSPWAHSDLEPAIRNAVQALFAIFMYSVNIFNEPFHVSQVKYNYMKEFGLVGAYRFTNQGDKNYFNEFRYSFEHIFCMELLHVDGIRCLKDIMQNIVYESIDCLIFSKMSSTRTSVTRGVKNWFDKWYKNFGDSSSSRYTLMEINSFRQHLRSNNMLESFHVTNNRKMGVHPHVYKYFRCGAELENEHVMDYMSRKARNDVAKLSRKAETIEKRTSMVWDVIESKQAQTKRDGQAITAEFWMNRLQDLHDIHFEYKERGRSFIDWATYNT